ncbi:MAG: hypothetical protein ABF240_07420 [Flavobacteriales bacterium]
MKGFLWTFASVFCLFFVVTFEFEYSILPELYKLVNPFFEALIRFSGTVFFGQGSNFNSEISSDSLGLFVHLFNMFFISIGIALLVTVVLRFKTVNIRLKLLQILTYYLSLQLLIYGFDKLFKGQFFYPEPNILHTNLRDLSPDILYWSTMGMSKGYSMFLGGAELLVAFLLWFRNTRLIALIIGTGIMIHVVAVNFGFDISVKVYSCFLLACFILVLSPYFSFLIPVFTLKSPSEIPQISHPNLRLNSKLNKAMKWGVICLLLAEGLFPYISTGNYNDDAVNRPKFHGAYSVSPNKYGVEKFYIHRAGYLIFEDENRIKEDFQMELDTMNQEIVLWDYRNKKESRWLYTSQEDNLTSLISKSDTTQYFQCKPIH